MGLFFAVLSSFCSVSAQEVSPAQVPVAEDAAGWEKAGSEVNEAAHAVGDATVDSSKKAWKATREGSVEAWDATKEGTKKAMDATKEGSAEAWEATKEKSKSTWEAGKKKVHDATAPAPATPVGE